MLLGLVMPHNFKVLSKDTGDGALASNYVSYGLNSLKGVI